MSTRARRRPVARAGPLAAPLRLPGRRYSTGASVHTARGVRREAVPEDRMDPTLGPTLRMGCCRALDRELLAVASAGAAEHEVPGDGGGHWDIIDTAARRKVVVPVLAFRVRKR